MKVTYDETAGQLHMEPEHKRDEMTIRRLFLDDLVAGCGFVPHTDTPAHCQVSLVKRLDEETI